MITLQSIRIRNFRAVAEATFKPLEEGITGIFGSNGAGKTTFLSATMFALYGVYPPDASLASLRREGSEGECSVSVLFKHLGQTVEVLRELKGKANKVIVNVYVDGIPQTVTSVGAANQWVIKRLGIDAAGFMTAFVVRQKELDLLITARPAERKQIIEKLAGIDTINFALKAAREDENQAKKVLATLPGSEAGVDEAENQLNLLTGKLDQLNANKDSLYAEQQRLTLKQRSVQVDFNKMKDEELENFKRASSLENLAKELASLEDQKSKLSYLASVKDTDDVESLRAEHKKLVSDIKEKHNTLISARLEQNTRRNTISQEISKIEANNAVIESLQVVEETKIDLEAKFIEAESVRAASLERKSILLSKKSDLVESIALLAHSTACPTCHSDLADPARLIRSFESSVGEYTVEINNLMLALGAAVNVIEDSTVKLTALTKRETLNGENEDASFKIEAAQSADNESEINELEASISAMEESKQQVTELGIRAANLVTDRSSLQVIVEKIDLNLIETDALEALTTTTKISFSPEGLNKLRLSLASLQIEIDGNTPKLDTVSSEKSATESRLNMAKITYKNFSEQWARKKTLMHNQERLVLTTDMLDKFRSDSISSLAPELSEFATALISDMTNGDFNEIRLDDEFNASVVDSSGTIRSVSWLSGGEVSAVALAMRIAIGFLITGGNPQLLWLDEVLTAQDTDRRTAMLSMIRALPIDQIVLINHTHEAADIVDKSVTLIKDLAKGSYIADE